MFVEVITKKSPQTNKLIIILANKIIHFKTILLDIILTYQNIKKRDNIDIILTCRNGVKTSFLTRNICNLHIKNIMHFVIFTEDVKEYLAFKKNFSQL